MADVVIVGAGLGGLATAARLAKLGHRVTVCERGEAPGGLLRQVRCGALTWDATPYQTTIPAVLRDLFRKSGRPLERYVDLELSTPARRHVFLDGTVLDLPTGSRAGQLDAVSAALGPAAGAAWTRFVDDQADPLWATLRAEVLDPPDGATRLGERRLGRTLRLGRPLERHLARELRTDLRLRQLAGYPVERTGDRLGDQPAVRAVEPYVERTFGVWRAVGGAGALAAALTTRMEERSVDLRYGAEVVSIRTHGDRVTGVGLAGGSTVAADVVVTAVDPHRVVERLLQHPLAIEAAKLFTPASDVPAGTVTYLCVADSPAGTSGSDGTAKADALPVGMPPGNPSASPAQGVRHGDPLGALPAEVVFHGDPLVTLTTDGGLVDEAVEIGSDRRRHAWTVTTWGATGQDPLATMAERGLDLRHLVITSETVRLQPPSPASAGPRVAARRAALAHPLPGLFLLGTALVLGSTVPYVAWQAASVAELVGKA